MRVLKTIRLRLRSVFRSSRVEHDLTEELRDHLERQIELHIAAGLSRADAHAAAHREFGNVGLIQEQCRDTRRVGWLEDFTRDVAYALRSMRRAPGHTAVTALSLAVGIGANTATFTLVNTLLLRPLPVKNPQQLVELGFETTSGAGNFPYPLYERVRDQNSTFSHVLAVSSPVIRADGDGADHPPIGRYVSGNFFEALGVTAAVGRLLTPADDRLDSAVDGLIPAVISHGLSQRVFGGEATVLGQTIAVGATPGKAGIRFSIVGVLPREFNGLTVGRPDDFYVPLASEPKVASRSLLNSPSAGWLKVVARLNAGVSRQTAKADVEVIYSRFVDSAVTLSSDTETRQRRARRVFVESARTGLSGPRREFGRPLLLLMGAVALVLVIACANVVNLLLARGLARHAEIGMRLALGASRGRLLRQLLAESAVLGMIGGSVGFALALWGTPPIARLMANEDPAVVYEVTPNGTVLMFTALVSLGSALAAGLLPAIRASRANMPSLREDVGSRAARGGVSLWTRCVIVFQMALSLLLLASALLLVTTLRNFRTGDFGFDREGVVSMGLEPGRAGYAGDRRLAYYRAVLERARSIPGVQSAALSLGVLSAGVNTSFAVEGHPRDPEATVFVNDVTDGYFQVMGTKFVLGRDFGPQDGPRSTPVVIINDTVASRYFGARNPIGERVQAGRRGLLEVVGVVATTTYESLRETASPIIYVHAFQSASADTGNLALVVKTVGDPMPIAVAVRRAVQDMGRVRVSLPQTLSSQLERALVEERLIARVLGVFALLAIALAAAGLYGVLAYSTARRTAEIGIRLALGASRAAVLWRVLAEAGKLAALGVVIGVPSAVALTRLLSNVLYGVAPTDPGVLATVALSLFCIALIAASVPAWRASRVDPVVALRHE